MRTRFLARLQVIQIAIALMGTPIAIGYYRWRTLNSLHWLCLLALFCAGVFVFGVACQRNRARQ